MLLLRTSAVLYVLAILTVTLLPSGGNTFAAGWDTRITPGVQNAMHMPAYIVMVPLLMAAFGRTARRPWLALGLITLGCMTLGIVTEWLQAAFIPGRYGSLTDALSNTVGCLLGAVVSYQLSVVSNMLALKTHRDSASLTTDNCQLSTSLAILCFASGYEAPPTSKHHVMHVLADQGNVVLWVNYHASRMPTASGSDLRYIARKLRQVVAGLKNPRENVYVLTPLVVPLPSSAFARRLNRALLTWQIRRALREVSPGPDTPLELWSFTPDVAYLLDRFGQQRVVYYCVDDHSQFTGYDTQQVLRDEEALCRRADLVITTSGPLQESRKPWNPNTILVPHGVDYEHFARALDDNLPEPAELAAIPRPRLGFFGLLRDWVDLDLLAEVARRRPDWHVVLLGDSTVDLSPYRSLANMHFLGPKPYAELPAWCRGFDVGLIPFKLNALTHAVNPIKLREYLAAGLPVVSTPLPEVERYAQGEVECRVGGSGQAGDRTSPTYESQLREESLQQAAAGRVHPRGEPAVRDEQRVSASRSSISDLRSPIHFASASLPPFPSSWVSLADGPDAFTAALDAILQEEVVSCQVSVDSNERSSACRVGGSGQADNRTVSTHESQPCEESSQQAAPGRVHPRGEPAVRDAQKKGSAAFSRNGPEGAAQKRLLTPFSAARSAAMRSETWQEKVRYIREALEVATAED